MIAAAPSRGRHNDRHRHRGKRRGLRRRPAAGRRFGPAPPSGRLSMAAARCWTDVTTTAATIRPGVRSGRHCRTAIVPIIAAEIAIISAAVSGMRRADRGSWWCAPPPGLVISVLPPYYSTVWFGGVPYYYADNVYYTWQPDQNGYAVVDPPENADAPSPPPDDATEAPQDRFDHLPEEWPEQGAAGGRPIRVPQLGEGADRIRSDPAGRRRSQAIPMRHAATTTAPCPPACRARLPSQLKRVSVSGVLRAALFAADSEARVRRAYWR